MNKILVGYDGGEAAQHALALAAQLARSTQARVGVISVAPLVFGLRRGMVTEPWDDRTIHREQLGEAKAILQQSGIEPELIEVSGDPAAMIEAVAERDGYDTVVIGARRKGSVARLLTGGVAARVAGHARSNVVLAH
jgi:nucleotide-binding universal stress UspA family protein